MPEVFLHGVEIVELDDGTRPVETVKSSVAGIVYAVTEAQKTALAALTPAVGMNVPILCVNQRQAATRLGNVASILDPFYTQVNGTVVVVFVEQGATAAATVTNLLGSATGRTGVWALRNAQSLCAVIPRLLWAGPHEFACQDLHAELIAVAAKLKAIAYLDMPLTLPGTPDPVAVTTIEQIATYRENFGSARGYLVGNYAVDNGSLVSGGLLACGLTANIDKTRGFWWSPSNQEILGISGVHWPHDYIMGDPDSQANYLNENEVTTIIREDGFRLWGNRTLSSDAMWAFLNVRRTADMIEESLLYAHLWAVDRNITRNYIEFVLDGVKSYLRHLRAVEAILGGDAYVDPELNTPDQIKQGKVYFDFEFTPNYPAEHVIFRAHLVDKYIAELFA